MPEVSHEKTAPVRRPRPRAIGSPDACFRAVRAILEEVEARVVLDCPAGHGAFTCELLRDGYDVSACDIVPEHFDLDELSCAFADLNDRLPYEDGCFDAVVCLNGLHRIWARGRAMAEMARVLRPGGTLVLTNANNANLAHRLLFTIAGVVNHNTLGPPHAHPADQPAARYRAAITPMDVCCLAEGVGLHVTEICPVRWSAPSMLAAPLGLLAKAISPFLPRRYRVDAIARCNNTLPVLFGDYLAIVLKKPRS